MYYSLIGYPITVLHMKSESCQKNAHLQEELADSDIENQHLAKNPKYIHSSMRFTIDSPRSQGPQTLVIFSQ